VANEKRERGREGEEREERGGERGRGERGRERGDGREGEREVGGGKRRSCTRRLDPEVGINDGEAAIRSARSWWHSKSRTVDVYQLIKEG
jgi:hypothetical protein